MLEDSTLAFLRIDSIWYSYTKSQLQVFFLQALVWTITYQKYSGREIFTPFAFWAWRNTIQICMIFSRIYFSGRSFVHAWGQKSQTSSSKVRQAGSAGREVLSMLPMHTPGIVSPDTIFIATANMEWNNCFVVSRCLKKYTKWW